MKSPILYFWSITRHCEAGYPILSSVRSIACLFFPILVLTPRHHFAQIQLDVEGHTKISGYLDLSHMSDTSSVFIGTNAQLPTFTPTYRKSTIVGVHSLRNSNQASKVGLNNSFFGYDVGRNNSGSANCFFGNLTGPLNLGFGNSFFGFHSGRENTFGASNAFFGYRTGVNSDVGTHNSFVGYQAGSGNRSGGNNAFLGSNAGAKNSKGHRNTFIGSLADQLSNTDSLDRAIALGYNAKADCSRCAVIGGINEDAVKMGVGVRNPDATLHLHEINNTRLKLSNSNSKEIFIDLIRNDVSKLDYDWRIRNSVSGNLEIAYHKEDLEHNSPTTLIVARPTDFSPGSNGQVDLGQSSKQWEKLWVETAEIQQLLKLSPQSKVPSCSTADEGSVYYDKGSSKLRVCTDASGAFKWVDLH